MPHEEIKPEPEPEPEPDSQQLMDELIHSFSEKAQRLCQK